MKPADPNCGICNGTGKVSQAFFDQCKADLPGMCLPVGTRCYCTVSEAEIEAELPRLFDDIIKKHVEKKQSE